MSKLFYDDIVNLSEVEREIKKVVKDKEAQQEIIHLVDELVHHRVVGCILDKLPEHHHEEFVSKLHNTPHDVGILKYLKERIVDDVEGFIKYEMSKLSSEILALVSEKINPKKITSK
ncbi:hypothetical protein C4564_02880 [Candidatus Microgenomates bacterium]|nr:MAG: hypothetical protein C4564_02880 [Candidatus Microgenomates bacterium]